MAKGDNLHDNLRGQLVQSVKESLNKGNIDPCHFWGSNWTYSSGRLIMEQAYKRSTERNVRPVDGRGTPHTYQQR